VVEEDERHHEAALLIDGNVAPVANPADEVSSPDSNCSRHVHIAE